MIGIFDSGVGGLTVTRWVRQVIPEASIIYVADQGYAPYGNRPQWQLQQRCDHIADWLIGQGAHLIVIACNTATAHCIDNLRDRLNVPIVGVEPGIKPAALGSQKGSIGILATENTLASERYRTLAAKFNPETLIINQPCPGLADAVEQGPDHPDIHRLLHTYVPGLAAAGIDRLVLGCTHYPLVADQIQALAGDQITLIDTGKAIAAEVKRRYQARPEPSVVRLITTAEDDRLKGLVQSWPELSLAFAGASFETAEDSLL
ncbi:MAG: glutamate racemase [Saccharospirillum sp.]|nr:glutamate racemase [Saccharospirillum sp.]